MHLGLKLFVFFFHHSTFPFPGEVVTCPVCLQNKAKGKEFSWTPSEDPSGAIISAPSGKVWEVEVLLIYFLALPYHFGSNID